ncbi:MAG: alpha/beta hydrolase [Chlorobiaceae bacterium]
MLTYLTAGPALEGSHAVLLLHAFPLSAEMWKAQIAALATAGYRVVAPNAYGIEGSEERGEWDFTAYAHGLAALLDSLDIKKATVAGLSMGGYQAFEFWRLYPERTASLVLCDTRAEGDQPAAQANREEFIAAVETLGATEASRRMMPNYFAAKTYIERPELAQEASEMIEKQPPAVINAAMRAIMTRPDSSPLLGIIRCPVLVLNGAEDRLTTPETAAAISDRIPHAKLLLLQEAGHISNLESPEAFNRALLQHLENVSFDKLFHPLSAVN